MNPNEQEIEHLLRQAPKPAPPAGLKEELLARVPAVRVNISSPTLMNATVSEGWLRRWWPVLVPAAVSLVCAVVLAVQQVEIRDLQNSIRTLSKKLVPAEMVISEAPAVVEARAVVSENLVAKEQAEIERLKQLAARLGAEVLALEQMQKGNEVLRAQLSAPPTLSQDELDALAKAKERAMSISCINNLKQIGLAVRLWAQDHKEVWPPDSLSMSNELNSPKVLVCPADTNRVAARNWGDFSASNCSYEYLTPSVTNADHEPTRVQSRCPIHGHVGLCDGSVQGEVAKKHPDSLKERDGKLYYEPR